MVMVRAHAGWVLAAAAAGVLLAGVHGALMGAAAYGLIQMGRALHEAGHAIVGRASGLQIERIRLAPLAMAVDFHEGTVWAAEPFARRNTAMAGSLLQAVFGLTLMAAGQHTELVYVIGCVHLAALANLLPLAGADGEYLFGGSWRLPAWVGMVAVIAIQAGLPLVLSAARFEDGAVSALVRSASDVAWLAVAALAAAPISQKLIDLSNSRNSGVYNAVGVEGVR